MAKVAGRSATFKRNTTGTTYVTIGQVLEIGDVGSTRALIDASAHGDDWKDWVLGQQDGNEVRVRYAFDPADAQQAALKTDYDSAVTKKFHLEHPSFTTHALEMTAIVTSYNERSPLAGIYEGEVSLKIVNPGVVVYTP